jgi:hypothetical protein
MAKEWAFQRSWGCVFARDCVTSYANKVTLQRRWGAADNEPLDSMREKSGRLSEAGSVCLLASEAVGAVLTKLSCESSVQTHLRTYKWWVGCLAKSAVLVGVTRSYRNYWPCFSTLRVTSMESKKYHPVLLLTPCAANLASFLSLDS